MVLATSKLKKRNKKENIVTPLNDFQIRGSSIDLTLGEIAKIKKTDKAINLFDIDCDDSLCDDIYEEINLAQGYELKPLHYLYASSAEKISIPNDLCGIILPRSSFTRIGLILPNSLYANPGYKGHLPIIIFNASNSNIIIPPYIRIMQLVLLELKGKALAYNKHKDSKYHNENLSNPSFSDDEIKAILGKLKQK